VTGADQARCPECGVVIATAGATTPPHLPSCEWSLARIRGMRNSDAIPSGVQNMYAQGERKRSETPPSLMGSAPRMRASRWAILAHLLRRHGFGSIGKIMGGGGA
jgi:hypothetical protein